MAHAARLRSGTTWIKVALFGLLAAGLAASWLLLALLAGKGGLQQAAADQGGRAAAAAQAVVRTGLTEADTSVQATFATPEYYELTGQQDVGSRYGVDGHLVFIVTEVHHSRVLDVVVPELRVGRAHLGPPADVRVLNESEHHRTRVMRWAQPAGWEQAQVTLVWPGLRPADSTAPASGAAYSAAAASGAVAAAPAAADPLTWQLPLDLGAAQAAGGPSPLVFLALTAGLFAALSPCLIQLTLYYMSALAGVSLGDGTAAAGGPGPAGAAGAGAGAPGGALAAAGPAVSRRVVAAALWFVAGVVAAYTAGGALAGLAGQYLQENGALGPYTRPLSILAGTVIVALGIYTGAAARAPVLCRLPLPRLARFARRGGGPGTLAMGFFVALGCLQCFGGAIFASLLVYVGSLGSPSLGALMLFVFSVGVAVPFLAAALAWSRVVPHLHRLERARPVLALAASTLMILIGSLMIADRFHWISGALLNWLPFLRA